MKEDIKTVETALTLFNSMILSGEEHTRVSKEVREDAYKALENIKTRYYGRVTEDDVQVLNAIRMYSDNAIALEYLEHMLDRFNKVISLPSKKEDCNGEKTNWTESVTQ